jgi:hypothetical protein
MNLVAERCHGVAEGAAAVPGRVTGNVVAIASGGNIEVPVFATLAGASKEK